MPLIVTLAQYPTQKSTARTLQLLATLTRRAAAEGVNLIVFPEAFLGGYPRTSTFGASVGGRTEEGRAEYYAYWQQAVDLGDVSPEGLGVYTAAGDGTRERLEAVARETGVFLVVGCVEKAGGSLWCACVFVDPKRGLIGLFTPPAGDGVLMGCRQEEEGYAGGLILWSGDGGGALMGAI